MVGRVYVYRMDVLRSAMLFDFLIAQSLVTAINAEVKPDEKPENISGCD